MAIVEVDSESDATPIDRYLAAQADLRVVERFARADVSGRTGQWSELIPLSAPPSGEQYRFEVDLDRCSGCKACITACHSLNGLDEGESFRAVGLVVAPTARASIAAPAQQSITTACHHCVDPGCLTGCPAEAYEKDPVTGIVKHLDDACIGCQYCTLTCPYEVPVYNGRLGIVRKCDMCSDRLADGEAPACIQGCPTQAISISTVSTMPPADELVDAASSDARLVPGAAPSRLTTPTTLYRGRSLDVDGNAVDMDEVVPQHAHLPLVVMLLLSQWSVGVLAVSVLFAGAWNETERSVALGFAAVLAAIAALASFTHLGQPLKAWRAVLGWRHSWLSREVIALSLYIALAAFAFALTATGVAEAPLVTVVAAVALAVGLATVGCSVMVYVATGRAWWSVAETTVRFGGTVVVGALAWLVVGSSWWSVLAAFMLAVVGAAKIVIDRRVLAADDADLRRTASLLKGSLAPHARSRVTLHGVGTAAIIVGAVIGDVAASGGPVALSVIVLGTVLLAASEFFERRLFFQACAPSTMPGAHR